MSYVTYASGETKPTGLDQTHLESVVQAIHAARYAVLSGELSTAEAFTDVVAALEEAEKDQASESASDGNQNLY